MNSWDCFDTLIARKYFHPKTVFDEVGRRIGDPEFKAKRVAAEKASNKTYEDIYARLPGVDPQIELDVEMEHAFPIIENMKQVKDGDFIISDMYLSAEFVEKLLRHCGLDKEVKIIVTPDGKKKGWIWNTINKDAIDTHYGDNYKSDIIGAQDHGINAVYCTQYQYTDIELLVSKKDKNLSNWMRYVRLQSPYTGKEHNFWKDQANVNLPCLALATLELPQDRNIAFTYRDCHNWHKLYEKMTGKKGYKLDSSRAMYRHGNSLFDDHVKKLVKKKCVFVDLQGKGHSIWNYFKQEPPETIYIGGSTLPYIKNLTNYATKSMEKHNAWIYGTVIDYDENGPVRAANDHPEDVAVIQMEAVSIGIRSYDKFKDFTRNLELLTELVKYYNYSNTTNKNVTWRGEIFHGQAYTYNVAALRKSAKQAANQKLLDALFERPITLYVQGTNGEIKIRCTKLSSLIPKELRLKKDSPGKNKVFVWDINMECWRTILYDNVLRWGN